MDKESKRYNFKSRIPIPVHPLPPMPKHLALGYIKASVCRKPLQTLSNEPGPSRVGKEKTSPPSSTASKTVRRSRSADASSRKMTQTITKTQRRRSKSVYKTPAYNRGAVNCYPAITPKVNPHTPLTLLRQPRQPRQGEMVVSMAGSPVMVPSYNNMQSDEKANCNIMLQDGTMFSLQPKTLQSQAYIPLALMDDQVLSQLKTLKEYLDKVVKLGERVIEK